MQEEVAAARCAAFTLLTDVCLCKTCDRPCAGNSLVDPVLSGLERLGISTLFEHWAGVGNACALDLLVGQALDLVEAEGLCALHVHALQQRQAKSAATRLHSFLWHAAGSSG